MTTRPPTAQESADAARRFARALRCNVIPCRVDTRRPFLPEWAHLHSPGSRRVTEDELDRWTREAVERERVGIPTAWQILPGSGRLVVLDVDDPAAMAGIVERFGETPLVVRSPTPGRGHLYYRMPAPPIDVGIVTEQSLGGAYGVKGRGSAIHAPWSLHRRGGWYRASIPRAGWVDGLADRLPVLDLAVVDADRVGRLDMSRLSTGVESIAGEEEARRRCRAWIAKATHLTGTREQKTWQAACTFGDLGAPLAVVVEVLCEWDAKGGQPRGAVATTETATRAWQRRRLAVGARRFGDPEEALDADALLDDMLQRAAAVEPAKWASLKERLADVRAQFEPPSWDRRAA